MSKVRRAGLAFVKKGSQKWDADANDAAVKAVKAEMGQANRVSDVEPQ